MLGAGLSHFVGEKEMIEKIDAGRRLRVKLGVDPTRPDLTFGHLVVFNKLKQFQDFGHEIILLIGDYTVRIGDPSGRSATRPMIDPEEARTNASTYLQQAFKILDGSRTTVRRNGEWFESMGCDGLLRLTKMTTVAQLLEREDFSERYRKRNPIALIEFLYPLLQAYDSVELRADVELGGNDQLFNLLVGRTVQREFQQEEQTVLCLPLLVGLDGHKKMSKSYDNYVAFNDSPTQMFGKLMSIPDAVMDDYFRLLLGESDGQIEERRREHPMEVKKDLARALVERFYGPETARWALDEFEALFSRRVVSDKAPTFSLSAAPSSTLLDVVVATDLVKSSKNELRRVLAQGGIEINGRKVNDPSAVLAVGDTVRVGKRIVFRLTH
jgi:tyrosyl-tRNA synthetase